MYSFLKGGERRRETNSWFNMKRTALARVWSSSARVNEAWLSFVNEPCSISVSTSASATEFPENPNQTIETNTQKKIERFLLKSYERRRRRRYQSCARETFVCSLKPYLKATRRQLRSVYVKLRFCPFLDNGVVLQMTWRFMFCLKP